MQRETVWLVEDEQGIADTLVYMLQQEGFAVEVFERGLPVLDKARTVQLAEKNITLHVTPTEVNVAAEPALLDQALGNLLDNAIDFTPESGRITLSAEVDQEHVTLKVLDTGSGIPDYALSRIFERFYSLPRANGQKSSGLGLAFVSEVARLFNGEVTLRNVQEGGVLASLRLHRHFT